VRRPTRVTAADAFPNAKCRRGREVTNRSVARQRQVNETERYFAKGLESLTPTVNEGNRMPTVPILSEVQRKCRVRGRTKLHEQVNDAREQKPRGGRGEGSTRAMSGDGITPLGRSHEGGGEGGWQS